MGKYNMNMIEQIENFKHTGNDSFNLCIKSLTHYNNKEPRHHLLNLLNILSVSYLVKFIPWNNQKTYSFLMT